MSLWQRFKGFWSRQARWPEPPAQADTQPSMQQASEQFGDILTRSREAVAQYGVSVRQLQAQLAHLRTQQTQLLQQIQQSDDPELVASAQAQQQDVEQRIAQAERDLAAGREAFERLRQQLLLLQEKLQNAKLKVADLGLQEAAEETQAALDQTLRDLREPPDD